MQVRIFLMPRPDESAVFSPPVLGLTIIFAGCLSKEAQHGAELETAILWFAP